MATMAKIKKIGSTKNTITKVKSTKRTHPALTSAFSKTKLDPKSHIKKETKKIPPQTFAEMMADITLSLKMLGGKSKIDDLLKSTTIDRQKRARTQLKIFMVKSLQKDVFKFVCRSSGLNQFSSYQVDIMFSDVDNLIHNSDLSAKDIFYSTNIKSQCGCRDFKYRYRYLATKGNFVLGLRQYVFPKITNKRLKGSLCKHQFLVMEKIKKDSFQGIFERYVSNKRMNKQTRIKKKDTLSTLQSAARSQIKEYKEDE